MRDQKKKGGGRLKKEDSVSFVCFDTRSHPRKRGGLVCVCTDTPPQQETFCRLLLYNRPLSSCSPPAPPLSPLGECKLRKLLISSHRPPSLSSGGGRWHFSPLATAASSMAVGQLLTSGPEAFSLFEKGGTLKQPVKRRPHPGCFFFFFPTDLCGFSSFLDGLIQDGVPRMTRAVRIGYRSPKTARPCGLCEDGCSVDKKTSEREKTWERKRDRTRWWRSKQYRAVLFNTL